MDNESQTQSRDLVLNEWSDLPRPLRILPGNVFPKFSPVVASASSLLQFPSMQPPTDMENEADRLRALRSMNAPKKNRTFSNSSGGVSVVFDHNRSLLGRLSGQLSFQSKLTNEGSQRRLTRGKGTLKKMQVESASSGLMALFSPTSAQSRDVGDPLLGGEDMDRAFASPYSEAEDVALQSGNDLPCRDLSDPTGTEDENQLMERGGPYFAGPEAIASGFSDDESDDGSVSESDDESPDKSALLDDVARGTVATTQLSPDELLQMIELDDAPRGNMTQHYAVLGSEHNSKSRKRSKLSTHRLSKCLRSRFPYPFRLSLPLVVECFPSMIISMSVTFVGIFSQPKFTSLPTLRSALLLAGELFDIQEKSWNVFQKLPGLTVLVPILLNLKGNLELNLAARLGSEVARGNLKFGFAGVGIIGDQERAARRRVIWGNLCLLQLQSVVGPLGFVSWLIILATGKGDLSVTEIMIMITASIVSSSLTALFM
ncbi:hypothetical protein HDU93_003881 [Gonapodya sp. JEL0774]|nr:hypothetical protein HDU93_003881 [Gonapodya sp. JEL0774]